MRSLIGMMLLLLIVGITVSVQPDNSTGKGIIPSGIAKNITNQSNKSINQTNLTKRMNSSNQTTISVSRSILGNNGISRSAMARPSKAAFVTNPVGSSVNSTSPLGEGMAMETPSQASFESSVI